MINVVRMDCLPLVEKYRPQKLDDIVGNKNQIIFLKKFIETGNIPNLLLNGEPGGGKTSAVVAFAKEYLGELYNEYCLDLNASDERGIEVVRSKIRIFSQRRACNDKYKLIILDESDNMTNAAQLALRRIMEQYSETTRFLFTCNNIDNIISSIQSICKIMFFGRIDKEDIIDRLVIVTEMEGIRVDREGLESIVDLSVSRTDLREMLNRIELVKANYEGEVEIGKNEIYGLCDKPSPLVVKSFLQSLENRDLKGCINLINELKKDGYPCSDICITLNTEIINCNMDEDLKRRLLMIIGNYNMMFLEGNDSLLMIGAMICKMYKEYL